MPLPNPHQAIIDSEKLRDYLLSTTHPVGMFKAVFFQSLGYEATAWQALAGDLRSQHIALEPIAEVSSEFGRKDLVRAMLRGSSGRLRLSAFGSSLPAGAFRDSSPPILENPVPFELLETVVLTRDVAEHGLKAGDLGAVVQLYDSTGVEVEFVTAAGDTQAVVSLQLADVRHVESTDLIAVRQLNRSA